MKEISVEEKAKRYDEAIDKAKEFKNNPFAGYDGTDLLSALFPEIKESEEDEKTINNICHIIRQYDKISKKENQPCWYIGDCLLWMQNIKNKVIPQPRQKWSEEDDDDAWLNDIISKAECNLQLNKGEIDFLKSLKYRIPSQLEQDFTDDDKEQIKKISEAINNYYPYNESSDMRIWLNSIKDRIEWLKSIISRQQPKWKPSDEHIYWLKWVINRMPDTEKANEAEAVLEELLEDLKKLNGE